MSAEPEADTAGSLRLRVSRQAPLWWESAKQHLQQGRTAAAIALLEELQREAADQFVTQDGTAATADWLIQQLADRLSPADLRTWEAAITPNAQAVWERWRSERRRDDLLLMCRSYGQTEPGLRAWQTLAAINRDEGRREHALAAFAAVFRHRRASRVERAEALVAQAALWSELGRRDRVDQLWQSTRDEFGMVKIARAGQAALVADEFARWMTTPPAAAPEESAASTWLKELGPPERLQPAWDERRPEFRAAGAWPLPACEPVVTDGAVIVRGLTGLVALEQATGEARWRISSDDFNWLERTPGQWDNHGFRNWFLEQLYRRAHADSVVGRVTVDARHVYAVQDSQPLDAALRGEGFAGPLPPQPFRPVDTSDVRYNTLTAYRLDKGRLAWRVGGSSAGPTYPLGKEYFCGPPLLMDDVLFVIGEQQSELRLHALQADHGELLWTTTLGETPRNMAADPLRQRVACPVSLHQDVLLCPTAAGAIVAVDPLTHAPRWAYRYPVELKVLAPDPRQAGLAAAPDRWWDAWRDVVVHSAHGIAAFVSPESSLLHALDLRTGEVQWTAPRAGGLVLLGIAGGHAIIAEPTAIRAHRLTTGEVAWRTPIGELTGRGVLAGDQLLVPAQPQGLVALDIADGRVVSESAASGVTIGNLVRTPQCWFAASTANVIRLPIAGPRRLPTAPLDFQSRRQALLAELSQHSDRWQAIRSQIPALTLTPAQRLELELTVAQAAAKSGSFIDAAKQLLALSESAPRDEHLLMFNPRRTVRADLAVLAAWDDLARAASTEEQQQTHQLLMDSWRAARESADPFAAQRWWERWRPLRFAQQPQMTADGRVFLGQPMVAVELALLATSDPAQRPAVLLQLIDELAEAGFHREADDYRRQLLRDSPGALLPGGATVAATIARNGGLSQRVDPWPVVAPEVEAERTPINDSVHHVAVPLDADSTGLFERLDVTVDRHGKRLRFSGGGQRGAWELPLPPSPSTFRYEQSLIQGWARGRVLVLRVGTDLVAVTPFDDRGEPVARVLWTVSLPGQRVLSPESIVPQMLPAIPGVRDDELRLVDGFGRVIGQVGPVRAGFVCYHDSARLVCVETLTGRKRWERFDLPTDAVTFGDDETVVIWSAADRRVEFVRALDGETLGERAWSASPDDVLLIRDRRVWRIARSKTVQLVCEDVIAGRTLWSTSLAAGTIPFEMDGRTLGIVDPRGFLQFVSADDGAPQGEALTIELPPAIEKVVVSRDAERWYVAFSERTAQQAALKLAQMRQSYRLPIVTGQLYAIEREGPQIAWRIDLDREAWPIDQPRALPVLVQTYATPAKQGPNFSTWTVAGSVLHLRDKRTGLDVLRREGLAPTPYATIYGDSDRGTIDVLMERDTFRLRYRPAPPAPPLPEP